MVKFNVNGSISRLLQSQTFFHAQKASKTLFLQTPAVATMVDVFNGAVVKKNTFFC